MNPSVSPSADPLAWVHLQEVGWWVFIGVAGAALVALTVWAYRGHREASRQRIALLIALRLLALLVALFTAVRPSWKVEEKPNTPSRLLIGIDLSGSMTVNDAPGSQPRIDFVRKVLAECQPTLDELQERQNCEVFLYAFGPAEFTPAGGKYDPTAAAAAQRSDYAAFQKRVLQEWANEKHIRGLLVVGDGTDNGSGRLDGRPFTPLDAAAEWRPKAPVHTFAVGDPATNKSGEKDVAFADVALDPDPVAIKNKFVVRARVNAFKLPNISVPFKVQFDTGDGKGYQDVLVEQVRLAKETNNLLEIPVDAPTELPKVNGQERRQIKVRVEIPVASCPGDTNADNNAVETYLNLTKEGLRVLLVDRLRPESGPLIDALTSDKRIDLRKVDLQTDQGGEDLKPAFDFDKMGYDVLILGNVSPRQLTAIDPKLPEKIAERVKAKGMGFMMIGGHATLNGNTGYGRDEAGWRGVKAIEEILPVSLPPAAVDPESARYMVLPEPRQADMYLTKLADARGDSLQLWDRLNTPANKSRFTALNRLRPADVKDTASVYLWAKNTNTLVDLNAPLAADKEFPLLVGQQIGTDTKGRVLVFAAQDTELWRFLNIKTTQDGKQIHSRFWRQLALWLAKQDQEESNAFARPEFPRVKVKDAQGIKVGLRGPNGAAVGKPEFVLKVAGPGQKAEDAAVVPVGVGPNGEPRAEFVPDREGEYTVTLAATGTADGAEVKGEATARFLAVPDTTEEMLRRTPDHELLKSIAASGGGKFNRIEDLPGFLTDLKNQPLPTVAPTRKSIPDWRRDHSQGFLPAWMLVFAAILVAEWGLRRWWGLV